MVHGNGAWVLDMSEIGCGWNGRAGGKGLGGVVGGEAAINPFGLSLSKPGWTVVTACLFSGRGPGVARRASNFLLARQKKVTKEKATPLSASPALRFGATCGARGRGAPQNSLRCVAAPLKQLRRVSSRSACVLRHTRHPARCAPRRIQRGWGTNIHSGLCFARPHLAGACASRWAAPLAPGAAHAGSSAATTRVAVRLLGCPPPVAAPAAGRLRGGMRVGARMFCELTRRGCSSAARQRVASSTAHPANAPTQVAP